MQLPASPLYLLWQHNATPPGANTRQSRLGFVSKLEETGLAAAP